LVILARPSSDWNVLKHTLHVRLGPAEPVEESPFLCYNRRDYLQVKIVRDFWDQRAHEAQPFHTSSLFLFPVTVEGDELDSSNIPKSALFWSPETHVLLSKLPTLFFEPGYVVELSRQVVETGLSSGEMAHNSGHSVPEQFRAHAWSTSAMIHPSKGSGCQGFDIPNS